MSEIDMLYLLLLAAMATAPVTTRRFVPGESRVPDLLHLIALLLTTASVLFAIPRLSFAWVLFCLFGLGRFVMQASRRPSKQHAVQAAPFVFSVVGAIWLASGTNGFGLLGYGKAFSYYAALHSHVLGWILVGSIAVMATHADRFRPFYSVAVLVCVGSFFLIAFGIDGVPAIKPIGVLGITLMVGVSQLLFLVETRRSRAALSLGLVSLVGFGFTIALAWRNELGMPPVPLLGVRPMVSLHGLINGLVVAPSMLLALHFGFPKAPRSP